MTFLNSQDWFQLGKIRSYVTKLVVQSMAEAGVLTPTATPPKIIDVKWEPPDPGWVVINTDGAV